MYTFHRYWLEMESKMKRRSGSILLEV
uniref:Uncharacterized protein n=1 Tax=Rhizophora mucronata TaxID=61149 RepID=A0A2P2LR22_RHIMU